MSIKVMSEIWEREDLDPYERLIMLSMADHANDEGACYPSISRLCVRTGMKERGVQTVIKRLVSKGFLTVVQQGGRSGTNLYHIHVIPRTSCTPAPDAPPHPMSLTPASHVVNPRTGCTRTFKNHQEPSESPACEVRLILCGVLRPDMADGFIAHRKAKRSPLTAQAAQLVARKLSDHPDPDAVVEASIMNGWTGVFPEKTQRSAKGASHDRTRFDQSIGQLADRLSDGTAHIETASRDPFRT